MGGGKLHTPAPQASEGRGPEPKRSRGLEGGRVGRGVTQPGGGNHSAGSGEKGAAGASLGPLLLEPPPPSGGAACGSSEAAARRAGRVQGPVSLLLPTWPALSPGGAPAGRGGCARAAALHQLGGLRHLLREPGPGPGGLPHEPEWLPKLLGRADRCVRPSSPTLLDRDPQEGACGPVLMGQTTWELLR